MAFGGLDFVFDGGYSANYGLKIMTINNQTVENSPGGSGINIFSDMIYRNATEYHLGVAQNEPLEFPIEFVSEDEIIGNLRSRISKWLFGKMDLCKLQIVQHDLQDIYFNCHLINAEFTYIAGYCHGITCTVRCDSPWAWQNPKTYMVNNLTITPISAYTWQHYNDTDDLDYVYPIVEFKMNATVSLDDDGNANGICSIINVDDNNREFRFKGLQANEVITVDCRNQTITSSLGILRSEKFNKKFLRLVNGLNHLELRGEFTYLKLTYQNARKIGG